MLKLFVIWDPRDAVIVAAQSAEHALSVAKEHGIDCAYDDRVEEIIVPLQPDVVWALTR